MPNEEELNKLKLEMAQCQLKVYHRLEAVETTLATQSKERAMFNEAMTKKMDALSTKFNDHDAKEMEKYGDIVIALENLTDMLSKVAIETEVNKDFIDTVKKYWVRITFASVGVGSTVGGFYWIYSFLVKNYDLVIVFGQGVK